MAKVLQQDSEGRIMNDTETAKTQKGYATYEKDQRESQKKIESEDAKVKDTIKQGVEKVRGVLGFNKGGSASARADGIAKRGKTRGKMC